MTGLYYNKSLATKVGMTTPPTTLAELTGYMDKAKALGLTAMVVHNKEGGGVFPFQFLLNTALGPQKVSQWVFNAPGATIDNSDGLLAATTVANWVKAGYLPDSVNALDATAADALFASDKGLFFPWGTGTPPISTRRCRGGSASSPSRRLRTVPLPLRCRTRRLPSASPSKSTNKDAAAAFLNFLSSDEARQIAVGAGFMPSGMQPEGSGHRRRFGARRRDEGLRHGVRSRRSGALRPERDGRHQQPRRRASFSTAASRHRSSLSRTSRRSTTKSLKQ